MAAYYRQLRVSLLLALLLASALMLPGQDNRELYLLTGFSANNIWNFTSPSTLLAVDQQGSKIVKALDVAPGSSSILVDHNRRVILIGVLGHLLQFGMDSPTKLNTITTTVAPTLLCTDPNGVVEEGCFWQVLPQRELTGIDLTGNKAGQPHALPFGNVRFASTGGFWSPGDLRRNGLLELFVKNGKLLFGSSTVDSADLGVPLPSNAEAFLNSTLLGLDVSNDDMFVIHCYKRPAKPGEAETHTFEIYDKKAGAWHSAELGAGPSVRGFGPWIATAGFKRKRAIGAQGDPKAELESPGTALRKRIMNPKAREQDRVPLDTLFQDVSFQFTGDLQLYNIRSRRRYTIRTGQGDSEILLVDGTTMYYRVNQTLYKVAIGQNGFGDPVKIISDESIQLAHWAFFGPPAQR